ncbi:MAG: lipoyl synthase [Spirochaetales bacterium]|nr:lipoyl synthase [Spirochaetales bacterium]
MAHIPKPEWLRKPIQGDKNLTYVRRILSDLKLHTVCQEAACPNTMECFSSKTATFMLLGSVCTRNCAFCNVTTGSPSPVDPDEPRRVAEGVKALGLQHVVVTSVTRDDLPDGGAAHFAEVIKAIRELDSEVVIEVLIPDFKGDETALNLVIEAHPDVINHNVETINRLYSTVRPQAEYNQSLELLRRVREKDPSILTKSGLMVGLGEKKEEVFNLLLDLRDQDCDLLTIGQYLAPSRQHHPVVEYVHPDVFEEYRKKALEFGFLEAASGPFVRSSYHAKEMIENRIIGGNNATS